MNRLPFALLVACSAVVFACSDTADRAPGTSHPAADAGAEDATGAIDGAAADAAPSTDAASVDAGADASTPPADAGHPDAAAVPDGGPGYPCPDPSAPFDVAHPGILVTLTFSNVMMLGNETAIAVAYFMPGAREDLGSSSDAIPLDTCVIGAEPVVGACASAAECAPEQQCVPERDSNGQPIPNSDHCETQRTPIDVGPFVATGFSDGPKTFSYNAGQDGTYTATPDGTLPPASLALDTDYVFTGTGAASLGPFRGTVHAPPRTALTAPVPEPSAIGGAPQITVDPTTDLALEWTGSTAGTIDLTLQGVSRTGTGVVRCRVADDGAFTIPADQVAAANLGGLAALNALTVKRKNWGTACGDGITAAEVMSESTVIYFVQKQQ